MSVTAIVQARIGSTRLPGKVMKGISGKPVIGYLLSRLACSKTITNIIVATSDDSKNGPLCEYVQKSGFDIFRGNENDVLDRYYKAAAQFKADIVVRLTGDCPLLDYEVLDRVVRHYLENSFDYVSNIDPPTFPDGLDTEVFSYAVLERAWREATTKYQREHVTPFIRESGLFSKSNIKNDIDISKERWTIDEPEDLELVRKIVKELGRENKYFSMHDIIHLKEQKPEIFSGNKKFNRNEGASMNSGVKLWNRAKKVIAGGNSLLSKRPDMFLPGTWPSYFDHAKGIEVWDLDGNKYIDMNIMGIGTNILGYGCDEVDQKVREVIDKGNMSTLNCPEEVYLAEKLIELHPWAEMVRYSRTGGEACAIAVRIARAASGKDCVAFCGYHGWHDWYLSSNIAYEQNLDGQLLPGLKPKGVPRNLIDTAIPFNYNDFEQFEKIVNDNSIGAVIMEPVREHEPDNNFLQKIRTLTEKKGIILIFDEVTAGFRQEIGGIHKAYNVNPDMAVLGKALGNGYAISAVIGKRNIMESAQDTFISSTFWTDRIGPVAALATIEVMQRENVPAQIHELGKYINGCWKQLAAGHNLDIHITGIPSLTHFGFAKADNNLIKTIIIQEMLKKGYIAGNSVYVCKLHSKEVVDRYIDNLDDVFEMIKNGIESNTLNSLLSGPVCQQGFKRLT